MLNSNHSYAPTEEPLSSIETWILIFVTLVMTLLLDIIFLTIFEVRRRSKRCSDVYDRRRLVWPDRVPPPLMQQRGLLDGYLGFEWWRLKISNPDYIQQAIDEYQTRKKQQATTTKEDDEEPRTKHYVELTDPILVKAECECYEESPFHFPMESVEAVISDHIDDRQLSVEDPPPDAVPMMLPEKLENLLENVEEGQGEEDDEGLLPFPHQPSKEMYIYSSDEDPIAPPPQPSDFDESGVEEDGETPSPKGEDKPCVDANKGILPPTSSMGMNSPGVDTPAPPVRPPKEGAGGGGGEKNRMAQSPKEDDEPGVVDLIPAIAQEGLNGDDVPPEDDEKGEEEEDHIDLSDVDDVVDVVERDAEEDVIGTTRRIDYCGATHTIWPLPKHSRRRNKEEEVAEEEEKSEIEAPRISVLAHNIGPSKVTINVDAHRYDEYAVSIPLQQTVSMEDEESPSRLKQEPSHTMHLQLPPQPQPGTATINVEETTESEGIIHHSSTRTEVSSSNVRFDNMMSGYVDSLGLSPIRKRKRSLARQDSPFSSSSFSSVKLPTKMFSGLTAPTQHETVPDWDSRTVSTMSHVVKNYIRRRVLLMQDNNTSNLPQVEKRRMSTFLTSKVERRVLTDESAELLRCVGLDAYMLLRFLLWGLDVSFWPFILACILLLPTYLTADGGEVGFYSTTVSNLQEGSYRHWVVVIYGYVQVLYILRRLWVEWELFLPLRYDFLEKGECSRYQEQYQRTCLVEFVPTTHRHDQTLYNFFDNLFPGQIHRAEVLLNTEHLRSLIYERLSHIKKYEDSYAKKVYHRAVYLKQVDSIERGNILRRCRGNILVPTKPQEPKVIVKEQQNTEGWKVSFFGCEMTARRKKVIDAQIHYTLPYHHMKISALNKNIEDEFIRLAQAKRRPVPHHKEGLIARWLGLRYIFGWEDGRVHSSTAFVEFNSLTAKQEAIQCNITGTNDLLSVTPVPEVRGIQWDNIHVSRRLIDRRRLYTDLFLAGCLIAWSVVVSLIRSIDNLSTGVLGSIEFFQIPFVATIIDDYLPAIAVEGLVRLIPFPLRYVTSWIRYKTASEVDGYVLKWYFGFRLVTFIFAIIGGNLVGAGDSFVDDPLGFIKKLSSHAVSESQFFMMYVFVAGTMQVFFRLSQLHNVLKFWITYHKSGKAEATSTRRLQELKQSVRTFHLDEFFPLFLFIFMISALYGWISPLSNLFVAVFFKSSYKVFKYMALYIYGNHYEGGGFLFYTITNILFYIIYGMIVLQTGYFALFGSQTQAGIFSLLIFVTAGVHRGVYRTFIHPSKTLSLVKARQFDAGRPTRLPTREMEIKDHIIGKASPSSRFDENNGNVEKNKTAGNLWWNPPSLDNNDDDSLDTGEINPTSSVDESAVEEDIHAAIEKLDMRYREEDCVSEITGTSSDHHGPAKDFFIYRQPSLNRTTWETEPRSYWEIDGQVKYEVNLWK